MSRATHGPRRRRSSHALVAAVALGLGLLATGGMASAASLSAAGDAEAHHCACGMNCRGSCCCAPRKAPTRPSAPRPGRAETGPCLAQAPCGAPGTPGAPSPSPQGKGAALPVLAAPPPVADGSDLAPSSHLLLPSRRASRLDEPPERPTLG